jgi:L-threonylcarbamoyladenylate synthase
MEKDLINVVHILKQGGIVIYPTDTAFGIGCRMDDENAVKRLFTIRNRPVDKAVPVLVNSINMALRYLFSPSNIVRRLMEKYWPGALTIVSNCKQEIVPSLVRGNGTTIGVRQPNHEIPLYIINKLNIPILGPSANFAGEKTPHTIHDIDSNLIKLVDYIIPGECLYNQSSTVVDCSENLTQIVRHGAVKLTTTDIY